MVLAIEAMRCQCADVEMELIKARRITPFFGESWKISGAVQTYCCPNCGAIAVRTVAPERRIIERQPPDSVTL